MARTALAASTHSAFPNNQAISTSTGVFVVMDFHQQVLVDLVTNLFQGVQVLLPKNHPLLHLCKDVQQALGKERTG